MRTHIKKIIIIFILICTLILFCQDEYHIIGEKAANISVNVGGLIDMEPYSYVSINDKYIGYSVEVMDAIARLVGLNITYKRVDFDNYMKKLEEGTIDVVLGLQYGSGDNEQMIFSKPFIKNTFNIFVKYSNNSIRNIEGLENKRVSVYKYDPAYDYIKEKNNIRVFVCDDENASYQLLKLGMVDAYIANKDLSSPIVDKYLTNRSIKIVGENYLVMPSAIATLNKNKELISIINSGIDKLKKSGELENIENKWFGQKVYQKTEFLYKVILLIVSMSFGLLLIVFITVRINKVLKKEVNERTKEIYEENKYKEEIMNSLFDCLITVDKDLKIETINNKVLESKLIINKNILNKHIYETELIELIEINDIDNIIINKEKLINKTKKINKYNDELYVEYNITPILIYDDIKGITITFKDITDEKKMKDKIIAKDKMESIGRLTAGIAHEIRNPLTSIDMYIKLLPEKIDNNTFRDEIVKDIPKEIARLNSLIKYLLDYSKPMPPKIERLYLKKELEAIIRLSKLEIDRKKINILLNIETDITILFDKQQFKQVMINLILNAIEELEFIQNAQIMLTAYIKDNCIYWDISNNGKEIDINSIEVIFEPFYTTKNKGCGLGLSIVLELCRKNNTEIYLDKKFKEGVKFVLSQKL